MAKLGQKTTAPIEGQPPAPHDAPIAPWPLIDRYPTILGSGVTLQTISSVFRLAQTGYRQQYVDLLDELLEREPHGYACLAQRTMNVVGGRVEIAPAVTDPGSADEKLAEEIATVVARDFFRIADLDQSLFALELAGLYYGAGASEISWTYDTASDGWNWRPSRLHMVHSRRVSYPDPGSWTAHIWDQGLVRGWGFEAVETPTTGEVFGLPIDRMPGKFLLHTPALRADYPTRDGLGRQLAYWFAIKAIAARGMSQYVERFGKPFAVGVASTQPDGNPRAANDADMAVADAALKALGAGSLSGATIPDSIELKLFGPGFSQGRIGITHDKLIDICNAEISKVVRGQTFTTEAGNYGSRSTADVGQSGELRIASYDAKGLANTLWRDLVFWMVKLNHPELVHLCPRVLIHVEDEPSATVRMDLAAKGAAVGMPIDADKLADEVGLPLVDRPEGDQSPRRLVPLAPMTPADVAAIEDPHAALEQAQAATEAAQKPTDDEEDPEPAPAH